MSRIVLLCGPSCVGKSPLYKAFELFYPELAAEFKTMVCYHSRSARPGEKDGVDYHFRTKEFIERLGEKKDFLVTEYRGDTYGVDFGQVRKDMKVSDIFYEANPVIGKAILDFCKREDIENLSVFMSPLSRDEIEFLKSPDKNADLKKTVTDVMRRKLLRRTKKQKSILSGKDLETIEVRAECAFNELKMGSDFDYVIANHDGEDSENWCQFYYPIGDARKTLMVFAEIIKVNTSKYAERWPEGLI